MDNKLKILFLFLLFASLVQAQVSEYEYKAAFIERFTRFIEWPEEIENNEFDSTFKIVVFGENPFSTTLDDLFSEVTIKKQTVKIIYTDDINEVTNVNLVFISSSEKNLLEELLTVIKNKPILILSDSKGFCEKGTHINMYNEGNYIRYEINKTAIEKAELKVSSLLFASAKIVEPDE